MKLTDRIWNSENIRTRLLQEAGFVGGDKNHYWAVVPIDGHGRTAVLKNYIEDPLNVNPHEMQIIFANGLVALLQDKINFDGAWLVGWTNPPSSSQAVAVAGDNVWGRLMMIWHDEDGDPRYTVESEDAVAEILQNGVEYYLDRCATAHDMFEEHFGNKAMARDIGVKEDQTKKETLSSLH